MFAEDHVLGGNPSNAFDFVLTGNDNCVKSKTGSYSFEIQNLATKLQKECDEIANAPPKTISENTLSKTMTENILQLSTQSTTEVEHFALVNEGETNLNLDSLFSPEDFSQENGRKNKRGNILEDSEVYEIKKPKVQSVSVTGEEKKEPLPNVLQPIIIESNPNGSYGAVIDTNVVYPWVYEQVVDYGTTGLTVTPNISHAFNSNSDGYQFFFNQTNEALANTVCQEIDLKELMSKSSLTYENVLKNCDTQQVNKRYQESKTLLHLSVIQRDKTSFREILKHEGLDLSLQDFGGNTVLHFIVKMSIEDEQSQFLDVLYQSQSMHHIKTQLTDALFQKKDVKGETVLHILTRSGGANVINLLLDISGTCTKALINCQDSRDKKTPIFIASEANRWELVKFLYTKGADLNIGTLTNMQPIHCACSADNVEMVRWLYDHGALPNQRLANGGNEKTMTKIQEIKDVIETHMRKARNARAKSKRKQKGQQ